jgi:hypothetical protein
MKRAAIFVLLFLSSSLVIAQDALDEDLDLAPQPFFAKVLSITSANSLIVQSDADERRQVVLAFLTIPVGTQPYAKRAHQVLSAQLLGRRVSIRPIGDPHDDFTLGIVYVGSENFNLDFLARGHAWVDYYQVSHPSWLAAQRAAREGKRGLYIDPDAIHPLDWSIDFRKAQTLVGVTEIMRTDAAFPDLLNKTFVGNRKQKIFVSMNCIGTWSAWPRATLVPFTTKAGAEDNDYSYEDCPKPKI